MLALRTLAITAIAAAFVSPILASKHPALPSSLGQETTILATLRNF